MTKLVEVNDHGLSNRMEMYPLAYTKIMAPTMVKAGFEINKGVPAYPPQPAGSKYVRTEELGRGFGSGFSGGMSGTMSLFEVKKVGSTNFVGRFGASRPGYVSKVVGDRGQQLPFFAQFWWRFEQVLGKVFPKLQTLFNKAAEQMAKFLEGKG
jgi:hypothetical protein